MHRIVSFQFASDAVFSDGTTSNAVYDAAGALVTLSHAGGTIQAAHLSEVCQAVEELLGQDLTDGPDVKTMTTGGGPDVVYGQAADTITIGSHTPYSRAKALAFVDACVQFGLVPPITP